ncbi:MAG TPA: hypothetical protein VN158_09920 [Caulobacter sp.]|nr:hypothetical protein [Caulobacter sp.]
MTIPTFNMPEIKPAFEYAFDALVAEMKKFQARLSDDFELGIVANGAGLIIHVESLRFSGQMFVFDGVNANGETSRLIQHFTQANIQMIAVPKLQDKPRRIGF